MVTTRIAPSPTGLFHLGTARTAYFNWLAARASGGKFILRIDDTDVARNKEEHVDLIVDTLSWLGLDYDELHRQSDRLDRYREVANSLVASGHATVVDGGAVALNIPELPDFWIDEANGRVKVTDSDRDSFANMIIMRSDGTPTYNFCSIIDDVDMGVDFVIRGHDHIPNTIKQIAVLRAMGSEVMPRFCHVGLIYIKDENGKSRKLSKRDGAASVLALKDKYSPEAILNTLLRLGWSPTDGTFDKHTKMVSKDLAVELFLTAGKMKSSPPLFEPEKLDFYERRYAALKEKNEREGL